MRSVIGGILLTALIVLLVPRNAFAHVLVTDTTNTTGAILHIIPDDDPIAGQEAELYFDMQNQLSKGSSVTLSIRDQNDNTNEVPAKIDGSLVTAKYTFPIQGLYKLTFTVKSPDRTYVFEQSQRVSRGISSNILKEPTYEWAEVILLACGLSTAMLIIVIFNRRKDIAKQSTF